MKSFILVNLYIILICIGGYVLGVLTGKEVRILAADLWILIQGLVLPIVKVFRKLFGGQ